MPRFKSIIFYQYSPKIKLFLKKKCKIFKRWELRPQTPVPPAAGALPPDPQKPLAAGGSAPRPPKQPPQLQISGYVLSTLCTVYNRMGVRSFCFEQFFLLHSVANLMMLTTNVCLIVFCLKSFICIAHCVTLTPSCYITLSYLFAKV